jgi:RNA polymerase sigma-70 factor (ECF subfamily)
VNGSEPGRLAPRPDTGASELPDDAQILAGLRAGDEKIFAQVVDAWTPTMLRLARSHVHTRESAADIVQETWLAVLHGIEWFEGRSALRTWVFRILSNIAKTAGTRERRVEVRPLVGDNGLPSVPSHRFRDEQDTYAGHWRHPPKPWPDLHDPEGEAIRAELRMTVAAAIRSLPARQRLVVTLRDLEGFSSDEVCHLLDLSAGNQRVLLHRGRAAVRSLLENHFGRTARWSATT